jgi:uroporphyrinogen III methyltransferase/synthase
VIEAPTIAIADPDDLAPVDHAIHQIAEYDWLVLTSANGVERLFRRIRALGLDARTLAGVNIAAVGSATGEGLESYGIKPDLIPPEAVGESLADALIAHGVSGRKILLLRAAAARSHLVDALTKAGAACNDVAVYQTICPRSLPDGFVQRLRAGEIDWITLTSPSSFQNLLKMLDDSDHDHIKRARLASIGPVTTRAVESLDYAVAAKADPHDVSGLVSAIKAVMAREQ